MSPKSKNKIRNLNDRFRKGESGIPGNVIVTSGISALLEENNLEFADIFKIVQEYDTFSEDNDPHKEHDFGNFVFCQLKCYWKFDYYDTEMLYGSEDPADTAKTHRVLTILLASEY